MKLSIALDVSKGNSHFQSFKGLDEPISKVYQINHDVDGFDTLLNEIKRIKKEYNELPMILFESTGIYHYPLKEFLDEYNLNYIIISPLLSAKVRKSDIRGVKTDIKDCASIASVYYIKKLLVHRRYENLYDILREKTRLYDFISENIKKWKVEFRRVLDIVFPRLDEEFENIYTDYMLNILLKYSHPDIIKKTPSEELLKYVLNNTNHRPSFCLKQIDRLKNYCLTFRSGCEYNSFYVDQLKYEVTMLMKILDDRDKQMEKIIKEASKHPNYECIRSIPGISDNLGSRLLAEIGDISRFSNYKKIIAYAGIDPMIYQSGERKGEHLNISKKGNKKLRYLLFLAVVSMVKTNRDTPVVDFFLKKRSDGLKNKEALVASMNKLLRLIYCLCKNGMIYKKITFEI